MARNEQREGSDNVRSGARSVRNGRLTLFIGLAALAYYLLILGGHQYSIDGIAMLTMVRSSSVMKSPRTSTESAAIG